ncbi:olfactory receptor 14J1-like [Caloenas nicobarica]|uniref:olfactory receptor 14J1-like n=1 Tax=Caloenas nicobarica TaxID=187106 RepID=UPI0032B75B71
MYFFLLNLALLDMGCISTTLHYGTLLGSRACVHMAAAAWATGFLNALLHTTNTFSLPLCKGNALDQFFCEIPQILKLSCSQSYSREAGLLVVSVCLGFGCFVFIVLSYVQILRAVLRIPSEQGRHKAFATCLPHLAVVSLFVSTGMFAYLKPPSISSPSLDLVVSVLYSVVPPPEQLPDKRAHAKTDTPQNAANNTTATAPKTHNNENDSKTRDGIDQNNWWEAVVSSYLKQTPPLLQTHLSMLIEQLKSCPLLKEQQRTSTKAVLDQNELLP